MVEVEQRVIRLEQVLEEFIQQTNFSINSLSLEIKEFKEEMRLQTRELNKRWGELANKMGTLIEDIIAPGAPDALNKKFGIEIDEIMVRRRVRDKNRNMEEFDVVIVGSDKRVYLIEVKSSPSIFHIDDTLKKAEKLKTLLYPDLEVIPILASLYIPENIIDYASKMNVYALGMKGDYLEILN